MKRTTLAAWGLGLAGLAGFAGSPAAAVTIKLATLAPEGSIWEQSVSEMGAEWSKETAGRVELKVYPGGVAGDEPDVVRKMRIGQLQAAVLTVNGLAEIDEAFQLFTIPFFFASYEELFSVLETMRPTLQARLEARGYVLLGWGHAGWVHLFSKQPIGTIEQMKTMRFFVSAGDDRQVQWWKGKGYRPVPLATTDILTGLQTGMIDAMPSPPLAALLLQWFRNAPHMLDLGFAPLVGGTVVQKKVWDKLGEADRRALLSAAAKLEEKLEREVPKQDRDAVAAMEKRGLKVTRVAGTPNEASWKDAARVFAEDVSTDWVPADVYKVASDARAAYRRAPAAGGGSR